MKDETKGKLAITIVAVAGWAILFTVLLIAEPERTIEGLKVLGVLVFLGLLVLVTSLASVVWHRREED